MKANSQCRYTADTVLLQRYLHYQESEMVAHFISLKYSPHQKYLK
jgi:hypothetical protein